MSRFSPMFAVALTIAVSPLTHGAPPGPIGPPSLPLQSPGVWGSPDLPRGPLPFDCVMNPAKSWTMAGNAPEHYRISRQLRLGIPAATAGCDTVLWHMQSTPQAVDSDFGVLIYTLSAEKLQGKRIRYSAILRTADVAGGAGLVARVDDANRKVLAFDDMHARPIIGNGAATRYEVVLDVAESAKTILIGFLIVGKGELWMNEIRVDIVGTEVPVTDTLHSITQPPEGMRPTDK